MFFVFCFMVIIFSAFLTRIFLNYALRNSIIDMPNHRSSHVVPTPRGGGVAIVLGFTISLLILLWFDVLSLQSAWVYVVGVVVAVLGFFDDKGHIDAKWRLLAHLFAACLVVYLLGGMPSLTLFDYKLDWGWGGSLFAVLFIVWLLNLYNFMDGIDGLASVEAVCVCFGGGILYWLAYDAFMAAPPLILMSATLGFLVWNFPPAKIFMGDAGSCFLGITIGIFSLQAAFVDFDLFYGWLILLGVFIVDATTTLIRRVIRGDKVYEAHRSHAYQYAARRFGKHFPVTVSVFAINILWLIPLSIAVVSNVINGTLGIIIAYAPLVWLAIKMHAGELEK